MASEPYSYRDIDAVYQKAAPVWPGTDDKSRQQGEGGKPRKKSVPAGDPRLDSRPSQLQHDEYTHDPQVKQTRDHDLPPIPSELDGLVLEQTREELQSLRLQHESLIRERDVIRLDLNRAAQQLNQNQAQKTLTSVGDDYIQRTWGSLRYGVKDWAIRWFSNDYMHKSPAFPNAGTPKWCAELMEDPKSYLKVPELRPVLVQAYLWCILCDRIFNVKCDEQTTYGLYWAGRHRTALAQLRAALRPGERPANSPELERRQKDYHMWRASTSVLLCQSTREYGLEAADIRTEILQTLRSLNKTTPAGMEDELKRLIGDAIELDAELNKQVALYQVVRFEAYNKRYGFSLKLGYATIYGGEPPTERHTVKLVVTPCLTKSGNSLGEHYTDYGMVIVESQVEVYPLVESVSNVGNDIVSMEHRLPTRDADLTSSNAESQQCSLHDLHDTAASLSSGTGKSQTQETSGSRGHKIIGVVRRFVRDAMEDASSR